MQNMLEDHVTDLKKGILGDAEWQRRWREGESTWHNNKNIDPYLAKNGATMFEDSWKRVFVPLCGKSLEMLWLYKEGHSVVGAEIAEQPVAELFQENNIDHMVEDILDIGKVYESKDGRLSVFVASIFRVPAERFGKFDVIWDNKSFTAINLDDHIRYRDLMCAIMKRGSISYLKTLEYDDSVWPGPPHSTSDRVVKETFGDACTIELLEETSPPGYGLEANLKDDKSVNAQSSGQKEQPETESTQANRPNEQQASSTGHRTSGAEPPKNPSPAQAAMRKSSFRFDRWYKLTLK